MCGCLARHCENLASTEANVSVGSERRDRIKFKEFVESCRLRECYVRWSQGNDSVDELWASAGRERTADGFAEENHW